MATSYLQDLQRASPRAEQCNLSYSAHLNMLFGQLWGFTLNTL